jgi:hypothetical protein
MRSPTVRSDAIAKILFYVRSGLLRRTRVRSHIQVCYFLSIR